MNWDVIAGDWKQLKAHIKSKWAKLTDDDVQTLEAKKDAIVGKIQERYGIKRDEAERQVDEWIAKIPPRAADASGQAPGEPRGQGGSAPTQH
jgi:uncharacterized protein YjbJ (UPF0337 family)